MTFMSVTPVLKNSAPELLRDILILCAQVAWFALLDVISLK